MVPKSHKRTGAEGEILAARFLTEHGIRIVARNFRQGRSAEIDLIGLDGRTLIFFEVKYRNSEKSGAPEEAVTFSKQRKICRAADYYRFRHQIPENHPIRFDVVAIRKVEEKRVFVRWIRNAFEYHI